METTPSDDSFALPQTYLRWDRPCSCGKTHRVPLQEIRLEAGVLRRLPSLLLSMGPQRQIHLVTHLPAWDSLPEDLLPGLVQAGFTVTSTVFEGATLVPDEAASERLDWECPRGAQLCLAVGSGVVHDLTRFLVTQRNIPFDSVPTAPSMDGYASGVAPLVRKGFKQTVAGTCPRAIWGDLDVLTKAPAPMIAAGVGDLLGKTVCLRDWELGALLLNEDSCPFISSLMEAAWQRVKPRLNDIRNRDSEGIQTLMESLILSGMGMVMAGSSRPASGAEHHLSHYWEMMAHLRGRPPQLHGLKVAVGTLLVSREVQKLRKGPWEGPWRPSPVRTTPQGLRRQLEKAYGELAPSVLAESLSPQAMDVSPVTLGAQAGAIRPLLGRYPTPQEVKGWLESSGIPLHPGSLGVPSIEVTRALKYAPFLRNRFTVLRLRDQAPTRSGLLSGLALGLVVANLLLAAVLVSAGIVASQAWKGERSALRDLSSRWVVDASGVWQVESRAHQVSVRSQWDGKGWIMSAASETSPESSRTLP